MKEHLDDKKIIELFSQGTNDKNRAFKAIVSQYGEILYRQIRVLTRNHESTNDVLQNVFIKVFQNLVNFKGESALYTWLFRIARNESLTHLQKEKKRTGIDVDTPYLEILAGHDTLTQHSSEQIISILQKAIDTLPEKQAMVFHLRYFEDQSFKDISKKLSISEGGLKANYHHARKKIEHFILHELNL